MTQTSNIFAVYTPHCAQINKDYSTAGILTNLTAVKSLDTCSDSCTAKGATCGGWLLTIDDQDKTNMECQLKAAPLPTTDPNDWPADSNSTALFGTKDCVKSTTRQPAMAEDAQELGYKEICKSDQYKEESQMNNTWNIDECDSKLMQTI